MKNGIIYILSQIIILILKGAIKNDKVTIDNFSIRNYIKYYYNNIDKKIKFGGKIYNMYYKNYRLYISALTSYGEVAVKVDSIFPDYYSKSDFLDLEKSLIKSLSNWYTYKTRELENDIVDEYFR